MAQRLIDSCQTITIITTTTTTTITITAAITTTTTTIGTTWHVNLSCIFLYIFFFMSYRKPYILISIFKGDEGRKKTM